MRRRVPLAACPPVTLVRTADPTTLPNPDGHRDVSDHAPPTSGTQLTAPNLCHNYRAEKKPDGPQGPPGVVG